MHPRLRSPLTYIVAVPLLTLVVYVAVYARYHLAPSPWLSDAVATRAVVRLRAALEGRDAAALSDARVLPGPLWVTAFHHGKALARTRVERGTKLGAAIERAAKVLRESKTLRALDAAARAEVAIKLDLSLAEGPIVSGLPFFFAKSIVPGVDGVGLAVGNKHAYLLPDDLYKDQLLAGYQPFYFAEEFQTGISLREVVSLLASKLDLDRDAFRSASKRWFRFRVQSYLEMEGKARPVVRLRVPIKRIDRTIVERAVERSARYVLRQQLPSGKFNYIYNPLHDTHDNAGPYNLPRHAGTTWFLALAYGHLETPAFRQGVQRAIDYLAAHAVPRACQQTPYACVGTDAYADLGSTALALVAISEYRKVTGDKRFERLAKRLVDFILFMKRGETGDFCHEYVPRERRKGCRNKLLYYTGEATLALAKHALVSGDKSVLPQIRKSMDFLTGARYDFFLGKFFIGDDHWTCIAADFAHDAGVSSQQYVDFCRAFARLNRRAQISPHAGLISDLAGAFNITPFFVPHNTPSGSRTEANVATYALTKKRGQPDAEVLDTVLRAVRYLVHAQIRPGSDYLYPNPKAASGGMTTTAARSAIRIDFLQHAAAALVRTLPYIPKGGFATE
ncbi:MAG: hypothetical protein KC503_38900 [Myxococcales bacterium]|nr:hypothetical protein [Myxococcales bacterium]